MASASARRRHGDVATRRRNTGKVAGLKKNAGLPLMVNLGARGGGRPLTEPPAWCQDPLAMCACSRENNQAPNLATLPAGYRIHASRCRGHGRAPDPTRRPPRAPRIDAGQQDPSQDPATGAEPRTVPPDARKHAPVTLVDAHNIRLICTHTREYYVMSVNQRYRIAVQGVAAEPSA